MIIVDIQGFQYKNSKFLCKEIAILKDFLCFHHIVGISMDYNYLCNEMKGQIEWLQQNLHGLSWNEKGTISQENISEFLRTIIGEHDGSVMVKGLEKKKWLEQYIPNEIVDMESLGCPKLGSLKNTTEKHGKYYHCNMHMNNNLQCSKYNAFTLGNWYINHCDKQLQKRS